MERGEFEQVYGELHPRLLSYARGQLDPTTAYDVVAATLATLWRKDLAFPADEGAARRVRSLAFEILKGQVSNEYRSRQRRESLWRRLAADPDVERTAEPIAYAEGASTVRYWLGRLSETDRHVIALFNAGYSIQEMADLLGCSVAAAARRRDRAKHRLRRIIDESINENIDENIDGNGGRQ